MLTSHTTFHHHGILLDYYHGDFIESIFYYFLHSWRDLGLIIGPVVKQKQLAMQRAGCGRARPVWMHFEPIYSWETEWVDFVVAPTHNWISWELKINIQSPFFCDLHCMTIITIIRGRLALGLVCSAVVPLLFHAIYLFIFKYYHTDCGNCVFTSLMFFF